VQGEETIIKKIIQKKLFAACLIAIMTISLIPIVSSNVQKTDEIKIKVLDNTKGSLEKNDISMSSEAAKNLKLELMKSDITPSNFKQEMRNKLILLRDNGLISAETADKISNNFNKLPKMFFRTSPLLKQGIIGDVFNIFSGTFFGMDGVKDFTWLNLTQFTFPFSIGTINAGFYGWNKYTGNGSVFTIGFLGFKYLYDYNETRYAFPYFPGIRGSTIGFTGLLIYLDTIIIGLGTSVATVWINYQSPALLKGN
jgi:hypothetical protein